MRIARANTKAINYACKNFHYSKSVPAVQYGYNVYNDNDEWCGVILYGGGANNNMPKSFGKNAGEVLELVRVALNGKQETTSKAVAMSLKQLHKDDPLCEMVVSYADNRQNHLGTIYQATNWIYLGKIKTSTPQYFLDGNWVHNRTIYGRDKKEELLSSLEKREGSHKFKYVFCFNKRERKEYLKIALPYPKEKDLMECKD